MSEVEFTESNLFELTFSSLLKLRIFSGDIIMIVFCDPDYSVMGSRLLIFIRGWLREDGKSVLIGSVDSLFALLLGDKCGKMFLFAFYFCMVMLFFNLLSSLMRL